jgi:hypothetical protein
LPSKDEHLSKAVDNQAFAEALQNGSRAEREWGVIARFYAAMHLVEAYLLSSRGSGTRNHAERRRVIHATPELGRIEAFYADLYNSAWNARYLCLECRSDDVIKAHDQLLQIRRAIQPFF